LLNQDGDKGSWSRALTAVNMGNQHSTSLNLDQYWTSTKQPKPKDDEIRSINLEVFNPYESRIVKYCVRYTSEQWSIDFRHRDDALTTFFAKSHEIDFEVILNQGKYARGQHIGWIIDEDFHLALLLCWDLPGSRLDIPIHAAQFSSWERRSEDIQVLSESLGLGVVGLLIQGGQCVVLDDLEAHRPGVNSVWLPGLDPDLDDFQHMIETHRRKSRDASPTRVKSLSG
jgi:hypothetical protein